MIVVRKQYICKSLNFNLNNMEWFLKCFSLYAEFHGRARRTEYWMFTLINAIIMFVLYIVSAIAVAAEADGFMAFMTVVMTIYSLAVIIPGLAVTTRRLHDVGKRGTLIWWCIVPIVNFFVGIYLLVLCCTEGEHGDNKFGPDPKAIPE